jgi:hypothetical protein
VRDGSHLYQKHLYSDICYKETERLTKGHHRGIYFSPAIICGKLKFNYYGKLLKLITIWSAISIFNKLYNWSFKFSFQKCGERIPNCGHYFYHYTVIIDTYRGDDKSLARPGKKEATATEDFEFHVSYL